MFFISFCAFFFQFFFCVAQTSTIEQTLFEANKNYELAENASTYGEKQFAFNQALQDYMQIIDQIPYPSSHLYQKIANTYLQLNAHAWAILYYEKALKIAPRDETIKTSLALIRKDVENEQTLTTTSSSFFLSPPQSIQFAVLFALMLFFVGLLFIWMPNRLLFYFCSLTALFSLLLLIKIMIGFYFDPLEGILIASTGYYREPHDQASQVTTFPKKAGTKLTILTSNTTGSWLKVHDSEGLIGYIPASTIRMI